jgi:thymidylate synthase
MNKLDRDYQALLQDILENGVEKSDRTGTGTISVFGRQIRHNMQDGFPLLTTKRMAVKTCMTELKWFLKGDTNIKYLVDNKCNIWNGDAYKAYLGKETTPGIPPHDHVLSYDQFIEKIKTDDEFAKKWGELGPIYGKQWRKWESDDTDAPRYEHCKKDIDQIQNLINELKTNPDSRRLMVSAWNVGELNEMVLPPCHYGFQVYTRELSLKERRKWCKDNGVVLEHLEAGLENEEDDMRACGVPSRAISLMWNQRSVDTFLGLPFNIASYGMLLHLLAEEVNMVPEELVGNLGDVHLYKNHLKQATEQIRREPYNLPHLTKLENVDVLNGKFEYTIEYYESHPRIEASLSN